MKARIFFGGKNVDAGYNAFHAGPEFGGGGGRYFYMIVGFRPRLVSIFPYANTVKSCQGCPKILLDQTALQSAHSYAHHLSVT